MEIDFDEMCKAFCDTLEQCGYENGFMIMVWTTYRYCVGFNQEFKYAWTDKENYSKATFE